ncbi:tetratricopeptide repeat protein [Candidatus Auribacterota bacterium]
MKLNINKVIDSVLVVVLFALIIGWCVSPVRNDDFWLHLNTGKYIVQNSAIPHNDIFLNNPPGHPWIIHSWLSTVVFYLLFSSFGVNSLILLKTLCLFFAFLFLFMTFKKASGSAAFSVLVCFLILIVSAGRIGLCRPMFFSYLIFSVMMFLVIMYWDKEKIRYLYPCPALMLLWTNLHGEFLVGIVFLALFIAGEMIRVFFREARMRVPKKTRDLIIVTLVCFCASLVNPYFLGLYTHILTFLFSKLYMGRNSEWAPIVLRYSWPFIILTGTACVAALICFRKIMWGALLFFIFITLMALLKCRLVFFSAVSGGLILSLAYPYIKSAGMIHITNIRRYFIPALKIVFILIIVFVAKELEARGKMFNAGILKQAYPFGAVEFIKEHRPQGRILNYREWGGFISYWLYPEYKVFIDGRVPEAAGEPTWAYECVAEAKPHFEKHLDDHNIDIVFADYHVFRRAARDPVQPIAFLKNWVLVYWDDNALIYLRDIPENKDLIDEYGYTAVNPANVLDPFSSDDPELCIKECRRSLGITPSERGYIYLGFLLGKEKRYRESIAAFKGALLINPRSEKAYYNMGVMYLRMEEYPEAEKCFEGALKINPKYNKARKFLTMARSKLY